MSYDTNYNGEVSITPMLTVEHIAFLIAIKESMDNEHHFHQAVPAEIRERIATALQKHVEDVDIGHFGSFDFEFTAWALQFDYSLNSLSGVDREERFLRVLVEGFFQPLGYSLEGAVQWMGGSDDDRGIIYFHGSQVESVGDEITNPGPSWNKELDREQLLQFVREAVPMLECLHASNTDALAKKGRDIVGARSGKPVTT